MAPRGGAGDKKEEDPEKEMKRKFRAKCLFRALGRLVMENAYWLIEDIDEYQGDDVKRRVEQAVQKKKGKQLLTIRDKALLSKPAADRTEYEKRYLYRKLGGLKCFKQYPNHVRRKLAGVMYFRYYGPSRVIVRETQEAHAMYFVVSGEMTAHIVEYDEVLQQNVSVQTGKLQSGDVFGDVELLHNMPRSATIITIAHCEMLMLLKEDFNNILLTSVQQQWDEVYNAMSSFTYFNDLDAVARRNGCIVAKMLSYKTGDTLVGDDCGVPNMVYFMLSGCCQMVESIQMLETRFLTTVTYTLYDPKESDQNEQHHSMSFLNVETNKEKSHSSPPKTTTNEKSEKLISGIGESASSTKKDSILRSSMRKSKQQVSIVMEPSEVILKPTEADPARERFSVRLSVTPQSIQEKKPPNLKTYFMQVCLFNKGSSFGFGENMRDRRIVALTPVDCLLLPSVWLMNHNTANIWTRIRHYLDRKIPTKKQLFKEFVMSRRWLNHREEVLEEVLACAPPVNWTTIHDVPYSIRMEEMIE